MRKLIALVAATAAMLVAGSASAASVDLFLTQTGPGSQTWNLTMSVASPTITVAAVSVQIASGGTGSFVISQGATIIDPAIPTGFSLVQNDPGVTRLGLAPGTQGYITTGATASILLGVFTNPVTHGPVQLLACNVLDCPTISNENYEEITDITINTIPVPEPGMLVLLGLGLGGISLARRKVA